MNFGHFKRGTKNIFVVAYYGQKYTVDTVYLDVLS